ncbi:hypothetical protein RFM99_20940 [Mesorhizobium sp. VK4C]|uniref:hypothetical protein n=1 Tax=Mesorhizobium captivum TaxID=3072319 RepID=UPI002A23D9E5|nr:hypothetical protein [Mesorhizobium sp. VK4C]MDX8500866.1 hypothetical protein [Mesorhizobium sp. VK4C]
MRPSSSGRDASLDGVSTDLVGGHLVDPSLVVTISREAQLGGFSTFGEMQELDTPTDALQHADLAERSFTQSEARRGYVGWALARRRPGVPSEYATREPSGAMSKISAADIDVTPETKRPGRTPGPG